METLQALRLFAKPAGFNFIAGAPFRGGGVAQLPDPRPEFREGDRTTARLLLGGPLSTEHTGVSAVNEGPGAHAATHSAVAPSGSISSQVAR